MPTTAQKRNARRAQRKYRRFKRSRNVMRRSMTNNYNQIHNFKRTLTWADEVVSETNIVTAASADESVVFAGGRLVLIGNSAASGNTLYWSLGYKFNLANLYRLTEFTSLFDSYKINKVVLRIMPYASSMPAVAPTGASVGVNGLSPILHYAIDTDSASAPAADETGIADLHEYANYRRKRVLDNGITITFRPKAQGIVFDDDALNNQIVASEMAKNTWYDATATGVDHFGLKMVFEAVNPTANVAKEVHLRCETTYYLSFKSPK